MGVNLVITVQLLSLPSLDIPLNIALHCFALSTPFLALIVMIHTIESCYENTIIWPFEIDFWFVLSPLVSFIGITALFWHFSWIVGALFALGAIYAFKLHGNFHDKVYSINQETRN